MLYNKGNNRHENKGSISLELDRATAKNYSSFTVAQITKYFGIKNVSFNHQMTWSIVTTN